MRAAPALPLAAGRRRARLPQGEGFAVLACLDVGLQVGPPAGTDSVDDLRSLAELPLDGIFLTLPMLDRFANLLACRPDLKLVIRLDWCNQWRSLSAVINGTGAEVTAPAQAAAAGADAVVHYLLLGNDDPRVEADFIARAAQAVREAHAVGLPCILEPLIRGGNSTGKERDPGHLRLAVRTAVELGADALKIEAPLPADMDAVLACSPVPVFVASTAPISDADAVRRAQAAAAAGAGGAAYSADFFLSPARDQLAADLLAVRSTITETEMESSL